MQINVADGGEDGLVSWEDGLEHTDWIPNRLTLFQCKATAMAPADCKKELCMKNSTQLKSRVEAVLDHGGSYVLFYGKGCKPKQQTPRLEKFREAIASAGKSYADSADIRIYDASKIAVWVNCYIPAVIAVRRWTGGHLPSALLTWVGWEQYEENKFEFVSDSWLDERIAELREYFTASRRVGRIVGLSGLGKSRLALEAFRSPQEKSTSPQQQALSDQVVYLDAGSTDDNLPALVAGWRTQGLSGIFVVDNCEPEVHHQLAKEITHADSRMSLLSLDYNPDKIAYGQLRIVLQPAPHDLIRRMLKQAYQKLDESDVDRIVSLTEGFPQMAVLFADAHLSEASNFGGLDDDALVSRLLWGRGMRNDDAFAVIMSCAVFKHLGFKGEVAEQRNLVADSVAQVERNKFYEYAKGFIERGILEVRGRFVSVKPQPLAIRLAAEWWKRASPERAVALLTSEMPKGMAAAMYDQFAKLDYLPEAQEIVRIICSKDGFYNSVESFESKKGANLFASLVEIDHKHTLGALARIFGSSPREQLLEVGEQQYSLIQALDKLCFWADTFPVASSLLLAFSAAKSKSSNPPRFISTDGDFPRLFQAFMPGTQSSLTARLDVLRAELASPLNEHQKILIEALGQALETDSFGRPGGLDTQGSRRRLKDYHPSTWKEVFDYWRAVLKMLTTVACRSEDDSLASLAREQVARRITGLARTPLLKEIKETIESIVEKKGHFREARKPIMLARKNLGPKLMEEQREILDNLARQLEPRSMSDRIRTYITHGESNGVQESDGQDDVDHGEQCAMALAEEFARDLSLWADNLAPLLLERQDYGYSFGYRMGEVIDQPQTFFEVMVAALTILPLGVADVSVFRGFVAAVHAREPELVQVTLERFAGDEKLRFYTVSLMFGMELREVDLQRALKLVKEGHVPALFLRNFAFFGRLSRLNQEQIKAFCGELLLYGVEGAWAALDIYYMQLVSHPDHWDVYRAKLREVVRFRGILSAPSSTSQLRAHYWEKTIERLLKEDEAGRDDELACLVAQEIVAASVSDRPNYSLHHDVKPILSLLLREYRDVTWPIFGDALIWKQDEGNSNLPDILGYGKYRYYAEAESKINGVRQDPLFDAPFDDLLDWCEQHQEQGVLVLTRMMPLLVKTRKDKYEWHSFAAKMLERYGDRDDFRAIIEEKMSMFSWSESAIPHYQQRVKVLEQLLSHPNGKMRDWAAQKISDLKDALEKQLEYEDERSINYY
jgi:hypothetical protein